MQQERLLDGRLKMKHLVLVTTIAQHGTLVATAEALRVSQPAVTRSLREAEDIVGVELFVRGPRGVKPTRFGEILVDHAHAAIGNLTAAARRIDELNRVGIEPVSVGTNLAGAYALLPRALVRLKSEHPDLTVTVIEGMPEELGERLVRGEVDLIVGRLQPAMTRERLRHVRLYDEPVRVVVRSGHPALSDPLVSLETLLEHPWILPARPTQLRDELDEIFARRDLAMPTNIIECSTILTLRSILLETDAIAPLPMLIGAGDDQLSMLRTSLDTVPREIGISTLADNPPPPSARILIRHLISVARDISRNLADPR